MKLRYLALLTVLLPVVAAAAFSDVPSTHLYFSSISYIEDAGIVDGYSDGTFRPENELNRAELTKIIINATFDSSEVANCDLSTVNFPDVASGVWYEPFVCVALKNNILEGYPDGTFKGEQSINYAETAKIIVNAYGYITQVSDPWYERYTAQLGSIGAQPPTIKNVGQNLTRGEMAYIIEQVDADIYKLINEGTGNEDESDNNNQEDSSDDTAGSYTDYAVGDLDVPGKKVLFFWASWCPYCEENHGRLLDFYSNNEYDVTTLKINYDTEESLKNQFSVASQDTFILLDEDGTELDRISFPSEADLEALLES